MQARAAALAAQKLPANWCYERSWAAVHSRLHLCSCDEHLQDQEAHKQGLRCQLPGDEYGREGGSEPERMHTEREISRPNWTGAARKEKPQAVGLHAAGRNLAAQFPGDAELDPRDRFPERREGADLVLRTETRGAALLAHWCPRQLRPLC
jgi:hypothetical protein